MSDHAESEVGASPRLYESVIKVVVGDPPERRARDISEGIGYACALLMDEYGWTAAAIQDVLERAIDDTQDQEAQRWLTLCYLTALARTVASIRVRRSGRRALSR